MTANNKLSDPAEHLRDEIETIIARFVAASEPGAGYATPVPGLSVARVTAPVPPTAHLDAACVCLCVRGRRRVSVGDTIFMHEQNRFLLTAIGAPSIIAIPDASEENPYAALRIDLDLQLARQVMAEIIEDGSELVLSDTRPATPQLDPDLLDCVARLVKLIERPAEIAFMSRQLHREILYRLLRGSGGGKLRQIAQQGSQGHRVAKAVDWLKKHFREPLRIEQLAEKARMGVSTLHRHFLEHTGMSPIQYQKQLRLHEARRLMLEDQVDVASAAFNVGYESSTQFIREYRRLFGEPPLRDVRKLLAVGGGQVMI